MENWELSSCFPLNYQLRSPFCACLTWEQKRLLSLFPAVADNLWQTIWQAADPLLGYWEGSGDIYDATFRQVLHLIKGWIIPIRAFWWNALLGFLYVLFSIYTSSFLSDCKKTWSMSLSLEGHISWDHHSRPFKLSCLSYIAHLSAGDEG